MVHLVPPLALALLAGPGTSSEPAIELPPGPAATALARVAADTQPKPVPADLAAPAQVPGVSPDAWTKAATWDAWSELVLKERDATRPDAERRARLSLLAAAQGRTEDAWRHLAAIDDPAWLAALMPRFLPGVPAGSPAGTGGLPGALADGVVLTPSLPPPTRDASAGLSVDRRAMSLRTFRVGKAVVSMRVAVEAEGVQIDVRHVAGESARFAVLIPAAPDYAFADEYVDWYRQDARRVPHAIEVKPGEAEHTLYARFEPRPRAEHARVPRSLPGNLREGGLWFTIADTDPERAYVEGIAKTLEKRGFGFKTGVRAPAPQSAAWSGVTFALDDAATRADKLAWLAGAIEEFALRPPPR
jgi:hypothetical protein